MRALRISAAERPAPNPHARPRPFSGAEEIAGGMRLFSWLRFFRRKGDVPSMAAQRRRATARRKPQPPWVKPTVIAALLAGCVALATAGGWWLWRTSGFDRAFVALNRTAVVVMAAGGLTVQEIDVEGRNATTPDQLLLAVGIRRGDPILLFDADAARERIEQIGWVKSATVQRILPSTILLRIVERRPMARWQIDGHTVLIDHDGKVLDEGDPADFRELRRVVGPGAADHASELFDMLAGEPLLFSRVRDAVRVRDRRWDLTLDDNVKVQLPEQNAEVAWRHLAIMEREQHILEKAIEVVDLRLPDRTVVRLTPDAAAARRPAPKVAGNPT
ncbi:MAG TPA: FtsQ-type POTRA domain-containing protein [Candidatus Cybelea sp.]|nr:FtsQ-type POTRA domain-containing protein [Candidatus Cybelea sp.]